MHTKRTCVLLILPLLLVAMGCDGLDTHSPVAHAPSANASAAAPSLSLDDQLMQIAASVPEFAGFYLDEDGALVVRLAKQTGAEATEHTPVEVPARIRRALANARAEGNPALQKVQSALAQRTVRFEAAQYSFDNLHRWRSRLADVSAADLRRLGVVYLDTDERAGRVTVAIEHGMSAEAVRAQAERLGIDPDAVRVIETGAAMQYVAQASPDTTLAAPPCDNPEYSGCTGGGSPPTTQTPAVLRRYRPVKLGAVVRRPSVGYCTLGFVYRSEAAGLTGPGMWTNDHCSVTRGAVDGAEYLQPGVQSPGVTSRLDTVYIAADIVASETYASKKIAPALCQSGADCYVSDISMATFSDPANFQTDYQGNPMVRIVKPTAMWDPNALPDAWDFRVDSYTRATPYVGQTFDKVGATTGWTIGTVTATCIDIQANSTTYMRCTNRVDRPSGVSSSIAAPGDSGSPVFTKMSNPQYVKHYGLLWGGPRSGPDAGQYFYFSTHDWAQSPQETGIPEYYW